MRLKARPRGSHFKSPGSLQSTLPNQVGRCTGSNQGVGHWTESRSRCCEVDTRATTGKKDFRAMTGGWSGTRVMNGGESGTRVMSADDAGMVGT